MTVLAIGITDARPASQIAAPAITFRLYLEDILGGRIHALVLRCQIRIEPRRRRYTPGEQERLYELFGDPSQWDRTLQAVTWSHTSLVVPGFERHAEVAGGLGHLLVFRRHRVERAAVAIDLLVDVGAVL